MAADLETVGVLANVIGVMDCPTREPEHLALQFAKYGEIPWRN